MSNMLEYKGYTTFIHYSAEDSCLYGKLEGIRSRIAFDDMEADIETAFHNAVDDYLSWCEEEGSEPEKPLQLPTFRLRFSAHLSLPLWGFQVADYLPQILGID